MEKKKELQLNMLKIITIASAFEFVVSANVKPKHHGEVERERYFNVHEFVSGFYSNDHIKRIFTLFNGESGDYHDEIDLKLIIERIEQYKDKLAATDIRMHMSLIIFVIQNILLPKVDTDDTQYIIDNFTESIKQQFARAINFLDSFNTDDYIDTKGDNYTTYYKNKLLIALNYLDNSLKLLLPAEYMYQTASMAIKGGSSKIHKNSRKYKKSKKRKSGKKSKKHKKRRTRRC